MTAEQIATRLGLQLEPYGRGHRLLSNGVPLFVLMPRAVVGGGTGWHLSAVLDLAALVERGRRAAA